MKGRGCEGDGKPGCDEPGGEASVACSGHCVSP
jgi:hypothetical protein